MRWGKRGRWVGEEGDVRKKNEMVEKREMGGRRGDVRKKNEMVEKREMGGRRGRWEEEQ